MTVVDTFRENVSSARVAYDVLAEETVSSSIMKLFENNDPVISFDPIDGSTALDPKQDPASREHGPKIFAKGPDEFRFATSTHLSLLTAAVLRQRSQINELLALVERMSRQIG